MKHVKQLCRVLLLGVVALASPAQAELTIEITDGVDNPTKIAIAPTASRGASVAENISAIVAADLRRSGLFAPIPQADMLSFPGSAKEVRYRDWRILKAEYLVVTRLTPQGENGLKLTFSLMNIAGQKEVFTNTINGNRKSVRDMAHFISDKVYKEITGTRGAFSTKILYVTSDRAPSGITYRLMQADADGERKVQLLKSSEPIMSPTWSPDGKEILYVSFETGRSAIYRQNVLTGEREQLTSFKGINSAPAWSPDGKSLALTLSKDGNAEIYLFDLQTRRFRRLTRNSLAADTEPTWMPDSKTLLFTSDRGGGPQIYKMDIASGKVQRVTFRGNYNARGRLAPDGRTLVMVHRENGSFHIAAYDLISKVFLVLTETRSGLDESPAVSPNGAMVLYATKRGGKGLLAGVSLDGGFRYFLPDLEKNGDVREPAWSPYLR